MITYRFPNEFYGLGDGVCRALRIWLLHWWKSDMLNLYTSYGIRILGVEISWHKRLEE